MKLAIVDDLKTDSDRLAGFVHTYMEQHQLKLDALDQFESGESFLSGFTSGSYDLIFLDIYMTGITGMETAKKIRQTDHDCRLIFITTSPEFAVESYDVNAAPCAPGKTAGPSMFRLPSEQCLSRSTKFPTQSM